MPEWYHAYTDAAGNPAGDYLGTISQMDVQIGRLRDMLRQYNVANNTVRRRWACLCALSRSANIDWVVAELHRIDWSWWRPASFMSGVCVC